MKNIENHEMWSGCACREPVTVLWPPYARLRHVNCQGTAGSVGFFEGGSEATPFGHFWGMGNDTRPDRVRRDLHLRVFPPFGGVGVMLSLPILQQGPYASYSSRFGSILLHQYVVIIL
jgi:hypothetical protein